MFNYYYYYFVNRDAISRDYVVPISEFVDREITETRV